MYVGNLEYKTVTFFKEWNQFNKTKQLHQIGSKYKWRDEYVKLRSFHDRYHRPIEGDRLISPAVTQRAIESIRLRLMTFHRVYWKLHLHLCLFMLCWWKKPFTKVINIKNTFEATRHTQDTWQYHSIAYAICSKGKIMC